MFTRGYTFHTYDHGKNRNTYNYGVCAKGASNGSSVGSLTDFYGILDQIVELEYPGLVVLKVMLFKCTWFDPTLGRGTRRNRWGGIDVNRGRAYGSYDPFILASQADQVCFVPYPTVKRRKEEWWAAVKIEPRGVLTITDDTPDAAFQGVNDGAILQVQIAQDDISTQDDGLANVDLEGEDVENNIEDVSPDEFDTSGDDDNVEDDNTETDDDSL